MKKLALLLVLSVVLISTTYLSDHKSITRDEVETIVSFLASDEIEGRDSGSIGIDKAATFIESYFNDLGVKPYYESYRDSFKIKEIDAFNIIGVLEGNDSKLKDEVVLLGAHYDHIGFRAKPVNGDAIGNGANDNASGTATVMTLAKHFANSKSNKRTLVFALFSGEEMGLRGSKHLAERLKSENLNLYTMINFEMTGVPFKDGRDYDLMLTGFDLSNMAEKMNVYAGSKLIGKSDVAVKYNLFKRSDNYPFYEQFKLPSQTISSCDLTNFDFYHHVDDESDKLDYAHMASVINKLIPAIEGVSNSEIREIKMKDE
ncbi:M20/M25/M40 family metallo-hydrolase [Geojedonia litorea]|uniref:M20/M25/M40 family metallo-hydrolase n=1 Tax=Geojedonia litorea TaxID=1268269 RepID=A0ABV9MZJ2_9FLAO